MAKSVSSLLFVDGLAQTVRPRERSAEWLRQALQFAVALELSTIPPYLCARWSIKDLNPHDYVVRGLGMIVTQEMKHLGQACNLMTAFGWTPTLNRAPTIPRYPGPLPGGVHPGLRVALRSLSKDLIGTVFMQIEFPSPDAVTTYGERQYPTIGAFYEAIASVISDKQIPIVGGPQLDGGLGLIQVTGYPEALQAIDLIRQEGEGAHGSPFLSGGGVAHYYRFAEMFWGRRITRCGEEGWGFCGDKIDFPSSDAIYAMAPVPPSGYPNMPEARAFNCKYTEILDKLQAAWASTVNGEKVLGDAVNIMREPGSQGITGLARSLMATARPDGAGNYGPDFRYLKGCWPFPF